MATKSTPVYRLVETAKVNKLKPYKYLEYLLSILPQIETKAEETDFEERMPWNPTTEKLRSS